MTPSTPPTRALVLGGGGVAGIAWELGVLAGLADADLDLRDADVVVGTSAGAAVGAQIASGVDLDELLAVQLRSETTELRPELDMEALVAAFTEMASEAVPPLERRRRVGAAAVDATTIPEARRRAVVAARLPVHGWPHRRLLVTAVDAASGELVVFDRDSGVDLVDAVAASCAVPTVWPAVTIDGRRYIDGGVRSSLNADLASGSDHVVVLAPVADFATEPESLVVPGERSAVVRPDEASVEAIGPDPLDPARRPAAARAGRAQGRTAAEALRAVW